MIQMQTRQSDGTNQWRHADYCLIDGNDLKLTCKSKHSLYPSSKGDRMSVQKEYDYPYISMEYDPNKYDEEEAKRLCKSNVELMKIAKSNTTAVQYAYDAETGEQVVVVPDSVRESWYELITYLAHAVESIEEDRKGSTNEHESDKNFSTYFAKPGTYVTIGYEDDLPFFNMNYTVRQVDYDTREYWEIFPDYHNYIEVEEVFADYSYKNDLNEDDEAWLYDAFGFGSGEYEKFRWLNFMQVKALKKALNKKPNTIALVRREELAYVPAK